MSKQTNKNIWFLQSLKHALRGLYDIFIEEKNMKRHIVIAFLVIIFGFITQCTTIEWLFLMTCIAGVITMECVNTLVENIVDVLTKGQYYEWARKIKDMAAGMVLIASIYAVCVAALIFIPKILR